MMKRLLIALLVSGIGYFSCASVLADDVKENADEVKKADQAAKKKEEEKPESKPVEGQKLKLQKANGGAIDIEIRGLGAGQIRIAPGAIRVLPGMPPKLQKAAKAKDDDKDEKDGDKKKDDKKGDDEKTTEDKIAAFLKKREVEARKPRAEQMQRRIEELEEIVGLKDGQQKKL